jgi:hypothetical protein
LGKQRVEVTLRGNNWVRYLLEVQCEGFGETTRGGYTKRQQLGKVFA